MTQRSAEPFSLSRIEAAILDSVLARGQGKSVCPSEIARTLSDDWRPLMPLVRQVGASLQEAGQIRVTQKGCDVRMQDARGPVRFALP